MVYVHDDVYELYMYSCCCMYSYICTAVASSLHLPVGPASPRRTRNRISLSLWKRLELSCGTYMSCSGGDGGDTLISYELMTYIINTQ